MIKIKAHVKAAEDIVENVKQRQKEFEKEEKALDNSERI